MSVIQRLIASHLSAALAATCVGFIPSLAFGQDTLEEVVVTARKREESLQETPVAVSALEVRAGPRARCGAREPTVAALEELGEGRGVRDRSAQPARRLGRAEGR